MSDYEYSDVSEDCAWCSSVRPVAPLLDVFTHRCRFCSACRQEEDYEYEDDSEEEEDAGDIEIANTFTLADGVCLCLLVDAHVCLHSLWFYLFCVALCLSPCATSHTTLVHLLNLPLRREGPLSQRRDPLV